MLKKKLSYICIILVLIVKFICSNDTNIEIHNGFFGVKFNWFKGEEPMPFGFEAFLSEMSVFEEHLTDVGVATVNACFRDLCNLCWMFHNRDGLSRALRMKASLTEKRVRLLCDFVWE